MGAGARERRYSTLSTQCFAAAPLSPVVPAEVVLALGRMGSCNVFGPDPCRPSASSFGGFGHHGFFQGATEMKVYRLLVEKPRHPISQHSSKILTIQQGITRGVSSIGKPCRPQQGFPR